MFSNNIYRYLGNVRYSNEGKIILYATQIFKPLSFAFSVSEDFNDALRIFVNVFLWVHTPFALGSL